MILTADFVVSGNKYARQSGSGMPWFNLFPRLTVMENINLAPCKHENQLSGGQQRVAIACALAMPQRRKCCSKQQPVTGSIWMRLKGAPCYAVL